MCENQSAAHRNRAPPRALWSPKRSHHAGPSVQRMGELQFATSFVPTHNRHSPRRMKTLPAQKSTHKAHGWSKRLRQCGIFGTQKTTSYLKNAFPLPTNLSTSRFKVIVTQRESIQIFQRPNLVALMHRLIHRLIRQLHVSLQEHNQPKLIQHPRKQSSATMPEIGNPLLSIKVRSKIFILNHAIAHNRVLTAPREFTLPSLLPTPGRNPTQTDGFQFVMVWQCTVEYTERSSTLTP